MGMGLMERMRKELINRRDWYRWLLKRMYDVFFKVSWCKKHTVTDTDVTVPGE